MNELLQSILNADTHALQLINGAHTGYLDHVMWMLSHAWWWTLMAIALLYIGLQKGWRQLTVMLLAMGLVILIADQVSASIIKPWVARLRPTHNPALVNGIHVVNEYRGGMYGFVSSHAANHFGVAALLGLMMRNRWVWVSLMLWSTVICYSRCYLGVHYPGDILCGALLGFAASVPVYALWRAYEQKRFSWEAGHVFNKHDARMLSLSFLFNLLLILAIAPFHQF